MQAVQKFGSIIDGKVHDDRLRMIVYAVVIYEDYARPVAIRMIERFLIWKKKRTTGIMQVAADTALSDSESVVRGTDLLLGYWDKHSAEKYLSQRAWKTVADYNADSDYVRRVFDVVNILAKRIDVGFRPAYDEIWSERYVPE